MAPRRPTAGSLARGVDERLGTAGFLRRNVRKAFPDHWSFLLGEIALYCFIILILTGTFLSLFFQPAETETVYDGAYAPLRGTRVSEAYASTLRISFDIRGGLLVRQLHHWAAILFIAAICVHLMRIFFTGAFRKPREINWLIGVTLFALALAERFAGYSLPVDPRAAGRPRDRAPDDRLAPEAHAVAERDQDGDERGRVSHLSAVPAADDGVLHVRVRRPVAARHVRAGSTRSGCTGRTSPRPCPPDPSPTGTSASSKAPCGSCPG